MAYGYGEGVSPQTGIRVNVSKSYLGGEIDSMIDGGTAPYDIVFALSSSFYRYQDRDLLAELSDVYNAVPEGESKPIKEKMNTNIYNKLLDDENKIYQMSWVDSMCSLMYNKPRSITYSVRTTTPFRAPQTSCTNLRRRLKPPKSVSVRVLHAGSVFDLRRAYLVGAIRRLRKYYDYYQGYYTKEDGTKAIALNGENMDSPGRKSRSKCARSCMPKARDLRIIRRRP